jgi:hypothetical protein
MYIGIQVAFFSIAVIAMAVKNEDHRYKRVLLSPFVMPISAVVCFYLKYLNEGRAAEYLASNIVFNYLYMALFICFIPAIAVLALHEVFAFARKTVRKVVP